MMNASPFGFGVFLLLLLFCQPALVLVPREPLSLGPNRNTRGPASYRLVECQAMFRYRKINKPQLRSDTDQPNKNGQRRPAKARPRHTLSINR